MEDGATTEVLLRVRWRSSAESERLVRLDTASIEEGRHLTVGSEVVRVRSVDRSGIKPLRVECDGRLRQG